MKMLINGEFSGGAATESIDVTNPATEAVLDQVPAGTEKDADNAVAAALAAFDGWKRIPASERATMLHQVADDLRANHDELVRLLTQEQGKPVPENDEEVWWFEETFDYYAEIGRHDRGRVIPPGDPGQFNFVMKEPYGVVAAIVPWNYPLLLMAWKAAPALAAGNTVVVKPSEFTPLATLRAFEVAFQHLPPGVVNVVTGYGQPAGEALVRHPDTRVIAFTGSLATGQHIARIAAPMMKHLHLELGGKDPLVIAEDAASDMAVSGLAYAGLLNAGQVCTSTERVYVHESRYPQFTEELADYVSKLRLGDGMNEGTDIGPMIRDQFRQKVEGQLKQAVDAGAKVLVGGRRPPQMERGYFHEPTVLVNVDHSMTIMRDETFGPVIPLMPYRDFDEAIRLANDTAYGLGASLMSNDPKLVKRFFEEVKAGTIWINDPLTDNFAGPFGGMKMSGNARELGQEGFDQFRETKHVHWDIEGGVKDFWYPY
jgi:betaine-aldehyde dehydrogenase